jgi:hypothetical protein
VGDTCFSSCTSAVGRGETLDDLVERNVLSLLKATGPNLAAQVRTARVASIGVTAELSA